MTTAYVSQAQYEATLVMAENILGTQYHQSSYTLNPLGTNCIGLVRHFYPRAPIIAEDLTHYGHPIMMGHQQIGDIVVIEASQQWVDQGRPWHFGVLINDHQMVHASSKRGVEVKDIPWHKPIQFRRPAY